MSNDNIPTSKELQKRIKAFYIEIDAMPNKKKAYKQEEDYYALQTLQLRWEQITDPEYLLRNGIDLNSHEAREAARELGRERRYRHEE